MHAGGDHLPLLAGGRGRRAMAFLHRSRVFIALLERCGEAAQATACGKPLWDIASQGM